MKFSAVLAIAAATGYVSAQDLSKLPQCSLSCLLTAVTATGCSTSDLKCSCNKSAQLTASVTPCVQKACTADEQAKTISALGDLCASVGVPISLPGAGSSAPASSAPASSAPASSAPASSAPASSAAPVTSAPASSAASSAVATSAPTASSNGTASASPSVVPYNPGSGASTNGLGFGAAIAAIAGVVYAL